MGTGRSVFWSTMLAHRPLVLLSLLGLAACARVSPLPTGEPATVRRYQRFEVDLQLAGTRHPDDVEIRAVFIAPSGREIEVGGFADGDGHKVRFTPLELGTYRYRVSADAGSGLIPVREGRFEVTAGAARAFVRAGGPAPHHLAFEDGTPFLMLGENRMNVFDTSWNHGNKGIADYLAYMARNGMNTLRVFIFSDCEREEPAPGPQPGCLETRPGRFDQQVARDFDLILASAERHGIHVILTAFAIGFTPGETWKSWEDNPYNAALGGPAATPEEFFEHPEAIRGAERRLRYLSDRYGHSPSLLAIDLLNEPEWDGNIPESTWIPWAEHLARHWKRLDPYGHPITVGSVGLQWNVDGDERPWYASPLQDVLQWHLYGKEYYDVHDLAAELTRKVRESLPYGKPVLLGEFGYGGEPKPDHDHTHVGIWATTFSGAGVLAHSAPPFNVDSDQPMTPERARHFVTLSAFLKRLSGPLTPGEPRVTSPAGMRAWSLEGGDARALWLMAPREGYGARIDDALLRIEPLPPGEYRVRWFDDVTGEQIEETTLHSQGGEVTIAAPAFSRHLAGLIEPAGAAARVAPER